MDASLQLHVGRQRSSSSDFISQMSDDILLMILSLLPIKAAVVTGSLSTRWRFLWYNLIQLNFEGSHPEDKARRLEEEGKYVNQVNSVIQTYNHPTVQDFCIRFGLSNLHTEVIHKWLQFAVNKKVEFLQLDFSDWCDITRKYRFPLRLFEKDLVRSNATVVELLFLKKLYLKNVNVNEEILQEFITNSPYLETISIHESEDLRNHIRIGGRALNLRHLEIVHCYFVKSIYLYDFDLVSFICNGRKTESRLVHLPKLKQVEICRECKSWESNAFCQLSSCAPSLQDLSIIIYHPMHDSIPELPNLKKLRVKLRGRKYNCLLQLAFIMSACPNLETLTVEPYWTSPIITRKETRDATNSRQHLKFVEIVGYYGRSSDFELAAFILHTAVVLKKIVIDTRGKQHMFNAAAKVFSENKETARSSIEHKLVPLLPQGAELVTLFSE